jgi:hypothetical protein
MVLLMRVQQVKPLNKIVSDTKVIATVWVSLSVLLSTSVAMMITS